MASLQSIQDKERLIQLGLSSLDNNLLWHQKALKKCRKMQGVLFLTRQACKKPVLKQEGKLYTATPSHPQNELIYCSVVKLSSPSTSWKAKALHTPTGDSWLPTDKVWYKQASAWTSRKVIGALISRENLKHQRCGRRQSNQVNIDYSSN